MERPTCPPGPHEEILGLSNSCQFSFIIPVTDSVLGSSISSQVTLAVIVTKARCFLLSPVQTAEPTGIVRSCLKPHVLKCTNVV